MARCTRSYASLCFRATSSIEFGSISGTLTFAFFPAFFDMVLRYGPQEERLGKHLAELMRGVDRPKTLQLFVTGRCERCPRGHRRPAEIVNKGAFSARL